MGVFLFAQATTNLPGQVQITWVTGETDQRPDFDVFPPVGLGSPLDLVENDILQIQYQTAGGNWLSASTYLLHTVVAADMLGNTMSQSSVAPVPTGSYDFRARLIRNGASGPFGASVSVIIDVTPPVLSSPASSNVTNSGATVSVTTNEANGTLYVVLTTSATDPTATQIKAGQDNSGNPATLAANTEITATGANSFGLLFGLTAATSYTAHFMHEDAQGNQSTVAHTTFTTSAAPPQSELDMTLLLARVPPLS